MTDLLFGREIDIDFKNALNMKSADYSRVISDLKRKIYRSEYHLYGSRMMGVATQQSDIDVYIEVGEKFVSLKHCKQFVTLSIFRQFILQDAEKTPRQKLCIYSWKKVKMR